MTRSILHVDMDAFFVAVELIDRPELRGRPVVVGGLGERGVVAAASYEARAHNVHSALAMAIARRRCPDAVFLSGRHERYREVSSEVMTLFSDYTPLVEPISLDEAFLDISGVIGSRPPTQMAGEIRRRVSDEVGLTCSVGAAPNKFLAKLATEQAKPIPTPTGPEPGLGVVEVLAGREQSFLDPLPVGLLWGVGPATLAKLSRLGVVTVGDVAKLPVTALESALGQSLGRHLFELSHGRDDRPVVADAAPKSVSHEVTYPSDLTTADEVHREVIRLSDSVGQRLRDHNLAGRTVTVKLRFSEGFRTISRSHSVDGPTDDPNEISALAAALADQVEVSAGIRLVGVGVSNLADEPAEQLRLELSSGAQRASDPGRRQQINAAVDEIRRRFGSDAIGAARLAEGAGLGSAARESHQWGPSEQEPSNLGDDSSG